MKENHPRNQSRNDGARGTTLTLWKGSFYKGRVQRPAPNSTMEGSMDIEDGPIDTVVMSGRSSKEASLSLRPVWKTDKGWGCGKSAER